MMRCGEARDGTGFRCRDIGSRAVELRTSIDQDSHCSGSVCTQVCEYVSSSLLPQRPPCRRLRTVTMTTSVRTTDDVVVIVPRFNSSRRLAGHPSTLLRLDAQRGFVQTGVRFPGLSLFDALPTNHLAQNRP